MPAPVRITMLAQVDRAAALDELMAALERHGGNVVHAAKALGVGRLTVIRLIARLGVGGDVIARWPERRAKMTGAKKKRRPRAKAA